MTASSEGFVPFDVEEPRQLPVIVLADGSGSMAQENKIETLNTAIRTMLRTLATSDSSDTEVTFGAVVFGGAGARVHYPVGPAARAEWIDLSAVGGTPMGAGFAAVAELLIDEKSVPPTAHKPTLVLVSDGEPTDEGWQESLRALLDGPGGSALRLAVAVGAEAGAAAYRVLRRFVDNPDIPVARADEVHRLSDFFLGVTRTVTTRVRSTRPDDFSALDIDLGGLVD
ncbi:vWA domain-containing protein [Amycolatopsis sp. NPDC003865]